MKKIIAILAFAAVFAFLAGCGEEKVVELGSLQQRGGVYVVPETQKPYSGKYVVTDRSNAVGEAGALKNGKRHGEITTYREDRSIDKVETFAKNVLNGKMEKYYKNGQIERTGYLKDGKRDGEWKFYYENGQLNSVAHYKSGEGGEYVKFNDSTSGKRDGRFEYYYESGKLKHVAHYEGGKRNGKWEYYDGNEKLERTEHYKDDSFTFSDQRDGKTYKAVAIGEQTWFAENLNYNAEGSKCYGEGGEVITEFDEKGKPISKKTLPDEEVQANCGKYGRLYNWESARKACPDGWHLPSDREWQKIVDFAGGSVAGNKLKAKSNWDDYEKGQSGNGTDDYGFSALPGGYGYSGGDFGSVGYFGGWWSATEYSSISAYYRYMGAGRAGVRRVYFDKTQYLSVRCLQSNAEWLGIPSEHRQDWGDLQIDKSVSGGPMTIAEKTYEKGIGTHANGMLLYNLGGKYQRLTAVIGLDEAKSCSDGVRVKIFGDGNLLADTRKLTQGQEYLLDIYLNGIGKLVFELDGLGNIDCDHVNIAVPKVYK